MHSLVKLIIYLSITTIFIRLTDCHNDDILIRYAATLTSTESLEELLIKYEDEKNSLISVTEKEEIYFYDYFYEEMDNRLNLEESMNMIFFGPTSSFLRLDAETILHILQNTKKFKIPISRALLAWDMVTDGKTAAFLQGREYLAFGDLLNVIPEEDLYYANLGDPSVLEYFANHQLRLHNRKMGILAAAYRRYFGSSWFTNATKINSLGYLMCGFPSYDLKNIQPNTFKQISVQAFSKLKKCSYNQTKTLYEIATHQDAYGEPYMWTSHEVTRLGFLFTCIPKNDINSIQLEAMTGLSTEVMKAIDQEKLREFTIPQMMKMNPKPRRIYILRMQLRIAYDVNQVNPSSSRF